MICNESRNDNYGHANLLLNLALNDNLNNITSMFEELIQIRLSIIPYEFPFHGNPSDWEKSLSESFSSSNSVDFGKNLADSTEYLLSDFSGKPRKKLYFKVEQKSKALKVCKIKVNLSSECMRKRIKSKFHRYMLNKLNDFVKSESKDIFFLIAPKKLRISGNLGFNQRWMNMTLKEAYTD